MIRKYRLNILWLWCRVIVFILLSTLEVQSNYSTLNASLLCPPFSPSTNEDPTSEFSKTALLPLAENRAVVLPCQLKISDVRPALRNANDINMLPEQSILIHAFNVTRHAEEYDEEEFKACGYFVKLKAATYLDSSSCNFQSGVSADDHNEFIFWSQERNSMQLRLRNKYAIQQKGFFLQLFITLITDNYASCRVQQYEILTSDSPTSCPSTNDYKSRRYCALFDCALFRTGKFQALYNTTHFRTKWLKVSEEEMYRVIIATLCPIVIVTVLVLAATLILACRRIFRPVFRSNTFDTEDSTTKTSE